MQSKARNTDALPHTLWLGAPRYLNT